MSTERRITVYTSNDMDDVAAHVLTPEDYLPMDFPVIFQDGDHRFRCAFGKSGIVVNTIDSRLLVAPVGMHEVGVTAGWPVERPRYER